MYATVAAAAALHQVLLRSLGEDKVVAQNVASGLFCALFVALGVADRPTLLATSMLGSAFARRRRSSSNWTRSRVAVRPPSLAFLNQNGLPDPFAPGDSSRWYLASGVRTLAERLVKKSRHTRALTVLTCHHDSH